MVKISTCLVIANSDKLIIEVQVQPLIWEKDVSANLDFGWKEF